MPFQKILSGSELNGGGTELATWAGLEVPEEKSDALADLLGGVSPLSAFFDEIKHGFFETEQVAEEDEDEMGPGSSDTYWSITTEDPEALRQEVRKRISDALGLTPKPAPKSARRKAKARGKRQFGKRVAKRR